MKGFLTFLLAGVLYILVFIILGKGHLILDGGEGIIYLVPGITTIGFCLTLDRTTLFEGSHFWRVLQEFFCRLMINVLRTMAGKT